MGGQSHRAVEGLMRKNKALETLTDHACTCADWTALGGTAAQQGTRGTRISYGLIDDRDDDDDDFFSLGACEDLMRVSHA